MTQQYISLIDWSGRAHTLDSQLAFQEWVHAPYPIESNSTYRPQCDAVPARLRGKASALARLVMAPFFELVATHHLNPASIDIVFASQFGEIQILESLFNAIYSEEALSPLDFCNSVHHTATGYTSIAARNQGISRTVSAGPRTFAAGLLEVWQLLCTGRSRQVALLVADEAVPPFFLPHEKITFTYGVALFFDNENRLGNQLALKNILDAYNDALSVFEWLQHQKPAGGSQ